MEETGTMKLKYRPNVSAAKDRRVPVRGTVAGPGSRGGARARGLSSCEESAGEDGGTEHEKEGGEVHAC